MMIEALERLNATFPLNRLDVGEYARFKARPLNVELARYAATGLGNVCVIHGKALGGLMKMDTLIITPFERDVPLFSYDYIAAMGKHTMLVEYYDTLLPDSTFDAGALAKVKRSVSSLADNELGVHWYDDIKLPASISKKTGKAELSKLNEAFLAALDAYTALAGAACPLDDNGQGQKRAAAARYVDGLLERGGPSTDAFAKAIGASRTRELFTKLVFGVE